MSRSLIDVAEEIRKQGITGLCNAIAATYPKGMEVEYQVGFSIHPSSWVPCIVHGQLATAIHLFNPGTHAFITVDGRSHRLRHKGEYEAMKLRELARKAG